MELRRVRNQSMNLRSEGWQRRSRLVAEPMHLRASATGELIGSGACALRTVERTPELLEELPAETLRWSSHDTVTVRSDLPAMIRGGRLLAGPLLIDSLRRSESSLEKNAVLGSSGGRVRVRRTGREHRIEEGVFLGGFAPRAYFHHLCERISRLALLDLVPHRLASMPILVPEETLEVKTLVEATRLLAPRQELIPMRWEDEYRVREAVWLDEVHRWTAGFPGVFTHLEGMGRFRTQILDRLGIVPRVEPGLRLFLERGDRRRSERAPEFRTQAERAGFRAWSPEQMSFADQVATWSRAEAVTGESGAAWSGTLFAPKGARGLVVTDGSASGWPHLGRISGMEIRLVVPKAREDFTSALRDLLEAGG